ncbi:hypothetical protein, partial [Streptomyces hirsutus]|uniref:hypothetical protein n=1 Tax=Streptomyces hirsutus TaxID=35620 RepID=UPI00197E0649
MRRCGAVRGRHVALARRTAAAIGRNSDRDFGPGLWGRGGMDAYDEGSHARHGWTGPGVPGDPAPP